jgi:hypothetical protein
MISTISLHACGIGDQCKGISTNDAITAARDYKRGMLQRSTREEQENYASDEVTAVRLRSQTNGYAANVEFKGRDGETLIALIEDDCYIGWTKR